MSNLKVIRASAGSGKTYRITADYLRLLFRNTQNYKHILAVTFTNKATEEMKSRILGELFKIANNQASGHINILIEEYNASEIEIRTKARHILNTILHNYSRFSISTIDSFFQRIIKAFAREAGIQFNFEVALNTNEIIEQAADQLLLKLEDDATLLEWLVQFAEERIEDGKNWDFKHEILKLGKELFNEKFKSFPLSFHKKLTNREELKSFQKQLFAIKATFESEMLKLGNEGWQMIQTAGLLVENFKFGKNAGVGSYFYRLSKDFFEPSNRILSMAESVENWLPKDKEEAQKVQSLADSGLYNLLNTIIDKYNSNYKAYKTSTEILSVFYTLGILADLSTEVANYSKENNVFVLAEAGAFLKAIISDNDSPFIYEKTGQQFNHFMIDEFQDTSGIQWHNFKPLIGNSLSQENENLLVGDVKQSIYRWRNSDWKIMASQLDADMESYGLTNENLKYNWRSKFNIIGFNNTFFSSAPAILQSAYNDSISDSGLEDTEKIGLQTIIGLAYNNCVQEISPERNVPGGYIKINFIDNSAKDWKQQSLEKLPEILEQLQTSGQQLKDIAILVRSAADGREVVDYLNLYKQQFSADHPFRYDVLSNESAFLKNSLVINFIISLFKYLINPNDLVNAAELANDYINISKNSVEKLNCWNPKEVMSSEVIATIESFKYLAPDEAFEQIISIFKLNETIEYLPFLQAFHDFIAEFMATHTSSFVNFIDYWEDKKHNLSVSVSQNQDAIRVMTIHKSKGLEFGTVIVPFCHWKLDHSGFNAPTIWCTPLEQPFNQFEYLPVRYSQQLQKTQFSLDYFSEKAQSFVDNLNLLYVAFTRAADNLYLFCPLPEKEEKLSTTSDLIFKTLKYGINTEAVVEPSISFSKDWKVNENSFEYGELNNSPMPEKIENNEIELLTYPSFEIKEKLRQRYTSSDFWDIPETSKPSAVNYGNIMHRMFQQIEVFENIEKAANVLVLEGLIKLEEKEKVIQETQEMLIQPTIKDWYNGSWKVMNEATIVVPNQHSYRPDRVMIKDNKAIVVDYKFGKKKDVLYNAQVKEYSQYLKEMGFGEVESYIWYLKMNELEKVN